MSKTEKIDIRVTPDEKAKIYLIAERQKITVTELLKNSALNANKTAK